MTTAPHTFNHDPASRTYRKVARIYELAITQGVDWRDEANDLALADVAFMAMPNAIGPAPSEMTHDGARTSWLRYAERLRTVQFPELESLLATQ